MADDNLQRQGGQVTISHVIDIVLPYVYGISTLCLELRDSAFYDIL